MRECIDLIEELTFIKQKKALIIQKELELSKPILADVNQVAQIYDWFKNLPEELLLTNQDSVHKRQFLFIVILLFSPSFLVGEKLKRGLRDELTRVFGFRSPSAVGNLSADVYCWYKSYQGFREKTNKIYLKLFDELRF